MSRTTHECNRAGAKTKGAILLVGTFLSTRFPGGGRSVCEDLADQLDSAGWSVIKTSEHGNGLVRSLDMIRTAWYLRHRYQVAQVDVFSGRAFLWAEAVCAVLRRAGKPYVLTLHSGNLPAFANIWKRRVRGLLRSAAVVTTPSSYLQDQMKPYREDLCLLPNALEVKNYGFHLRTKPQARFVWVRQFSYQDVYNPFLAVKALQILASELSEIKLIMVGTDNGEGNFLRFRQWVEKLGLTNRVIFPGGVSKPEVPYWMSQGDIYLNTTNVDNTPVTVLEAMTSGLCIISTNVGGIPYLLEHAHDALLVPPDDPLAMAQAIRRVLTEEGTGERLSRNARRKAEQFDWSVILPKWEALLTSVATNKYGMTPGVPSGINHAAHLPSSNLYCRDH